jgi:hypothetical protein
MKIKKLLMPEMIVKRADFTPASREALSINLVTMPWFAESTAL